MLSKTGIKLNKTIFERARVAAGAAGYSSVEEFIEHAIEKELANHEESMSKEDLVKKLKGLGYLE
jgi:hypothetical protein